MIHGHRTVRLRDLTAVALGLAIPVMASGRAVLQGVAALALVGVLVLAFRNRRLFQAAAETARSRLGLLAGAAFLGMAFSIPGSLDPLRSLDAWARTLAYLVASTLFWSLLAGDARARMACHRALIVGTLAGAGVILVAILGFPMPLHILKNDFWRMDMLWARDTAKAYAAAGLCLLPVLAWLALAMRGWWRVLALAALPMLLTIIVGTGNKSALAGILASLLVTSLVLTLRRSWWWAVLWAVWAGAATAGILTLVSDMPDVKNSAPVWSWMPIWLVDSHRQHIWQFTLTKIAEMPWLGHGINCIDRVAGAHRILPQLGAEVLPSHPHDWMLEILAETGIVGFVPVILALGWCFARQVRRYLLTGNRDALTLVALFSAFWSSSLFNFSIWSSWWLITFFTLSAIIAGGPASAAGERITGGVPGHEPAATEADGGVRSR